MEQQQQGADYAHSHAPVIAVRLRSGHERLLAKLRERCRVRAPVFSVGA